MHGKYYQIRAIRHPSPTGIGSGLLTEVYYFSKDYMIKVDGNVYTNLVLIVLGEQGAFQSELLLTSNAGL
jgi:hypothetical protein